MRSIRKFDYPLTRLVVSDSRNNILSRGKLEEIEKTVGLSVEIHDSIDEIPVG